MQRPRIFAAFSTAIAATIALCAFFIPASGGGTALGMTSTILRNLREAVHQGLSITIENLSVEGVHVDGQLQLLFSRPVTLAQLASKEGDDVEPESVYADLVVRGDETSDDLAGLDIAMTGAFAENNNWAFLRVAGLPDSVVREAPPLALALTFLRNGLLLDLNGLEEIKQLHKSPHDDADDDSAADGVIEESANDDAKHLNIGIRKKAPSGYSVDISNHRSTESDAAEEGDEDDGSDRRLEALVQDILSGKAGAERIAEVVEQTQQVFGEVESRQTAPGEWVLTARNIKPELLDADDAAMLGRAVLTVRYRQGGGIESMEMAPIGAGEGRVRLAFVDQVDASLLNKQRLIDQGHQPIDVSGLAKMFEGMVGGSDD